MYWPWHCFWSELSTLVVVTQRLAWRRGFHGGGGTEGPAGPLAPVVSCSALQESISVPPGFLALTAGAGLLALVLLCGLVISRLYWGEEMVHGKLHLCSRCRCSGLITPPDSTQNICKDLTHGLLLTLGVSLCLSICLSCSLSHSLSHHRPAPPLPSFKFWWIP